MEYIKLMRPKHYIKNVLIFLPLIFSGMFFENDNFFKTLIGCICFCLICSSIYIINDIKDKEKDKKHKTKCTRPISSGKVSVKNAIIELIGILLITIMIVINTKVPLTSILLLLTYFIINLGYSFGLKNVVLLDVAIIVLGFIIRVVYGATLLSIEVSNWLYLTIISISFYLALGKRRNEIEKNGKNARNVLKYYSKDFLDKNMYMFLSMAIVFYSLWATDNSIVKENNNLMIWTIPIVIILCMRYSLNIEGNSSGDPTEVILKDKCILTLGLLLGSLLFAILYIM